MLKSHDLSDSCKAKHIFSNMYLLARLVLLINDDQMDNNIFYSWWGSAMVHHGTTHFGLMNWVAVGYVQSYLISSPFHQLWTPSHAALWPAVLSQTSDSAPVMTTPKTYSSHDTSSSINWYLYPSYFDQIRANSDCLH